MKTAKYSLKRKFLCSANDKMDSLQKFRNYECMFYEFKSALYFMALHKEWGDKGIKVVGEIRGN